MVYECEECGASLPAGVSACPKCGQAFDEAVPQDAELPQVASPINQSKSLKGPIFIWGIIVTLCLLIPVLLLALNHINVQSPMNEVLASDPRNQGIKVSVHYNNYLDRSVVIYNMTDVAGTNSEADVFRVLNQFADKMQDTRFKRVDLAFRGKIKFCIPGNYFQQIGKEHASQNPLYTVRTFPENILMPTGDRAFQHWEGGMLGVDMKQLQDFNDFHAQWWKNDLSSGSQQ